MNISVFYAHILDAATQSGLSIDAILAKVKAAGIDAVEMDLHNFSQETDHPSLVHNAGLSVSCVNGFYRLEKEFDEEMAVSHVEAAASCGADKILVVPGFLTEAEGQTMKPLVYDREQLFRFLENNTTAQKMVAGLARITSIAKEKNIQVVIEDFDNPASPISSLLGVSWFLEKVPELGCAFDTGNFIIHGEDLYESWDMLKDRVIHVHCKDRSDSAIAVGSGKLPLKKLLTQMIRDGYRGTLAIEHYGAADQLSAMVQSAEFMKTIL